MMAATVRVCQGCGLEFTVSGRGKPARWHSDACRMAHRRATARQGLDWRHAERVAFELVQAGELDFIAALDALTAGRVPLEAAA